MPFQRVIISMVDLKSANRDLEFKWKVGIKVSGRLGLAEIKGAF